MVLVSVEAGAVGNRTYRMECDRDFLPFQTYVVERSEPFISAV